MPSQVSEAIQATFVTEDNKTKPHFFYQEKFELLLHYQQAIFNETEVSSNLRKLVNELITQENLEKIKLKFIQLYEALNQ